MLANDITNDGVVLVPNPRLKAMEFWTGLDKKARQRRSKLKCAWNCLHLPVHVCMYVVAKYSIKHLRMGYFLWITLICTSYWSIQFRLRCNYGLYYDIRWKKKPNWLWNRFIVPWNYRAKSSSQLCKFAGSKETKIDLNTWTMNGFFLRKIDWNFERILIRNIYSKFILTHSLFHPIKFYTARKEPASVLRWLKTLNRLELICRM